MESSKKFRKKPLVIEAIQFTGTASYDRMYLEWGEHFRDATSLRNHMRPLSVMIKTLEGTMQAFENDWIIKGVNDEFYPCKPDIFEKTYERVE